MPFDNLVWSKIRFYAIKNLKCQIDRKELRKKTFELLYFKEIPIKHNSICEWCGFKVDLGPDGDEIVRSTRSTHPKWHTMNLIECTRCPNFIFVGSGLKFPPNSSGWYGGTIEKDNMTCEFCTVDYWEESNLFES